MNPTSQEPQREVVITDFHRGWLIEVQRLADGFQALCISSSGMEFSDRILYAQPLQAQQKAIQLINHFFASSALKQILRELFEAEKLNFEEWQTLSASLNSVSKI